MSAEFSTEDSAFPPSDLYLDIHLNPMERLSVFCLLLIRGLCLERGSVIRYEPLTNKPMDVELELWRSGTVSCVPDKHGTAILIQNTIRDSLSFDSSRPRQARVSVRASRGKSAN